MIYKGYEVFDFVPQNSRFSPKLLNNYKEIGKKHKVQNKVVLEPTRVEFEATFIFGGYKEALKLRDFFNSKKGRFGAFWVRSFTNDIVLETQSVNTPIILTKNTKKTFGLQGVRRHILINKTNAYKIEQIGVNGTDIDSPESIVLDAPVTLETNASIEYMYLMRFKSDKFEIQNVQGVAYSIALGFIELQKETP